MPFSRRTLESLAHDLSVVTAAHITSLFFRYKLDDRDRGGTVLYRALSLLGGIELDYPPDEGRKIALEIAQRLALRDRLSFSGPAPTMEHTFAALELEGFTFDGERFIPTTSGAVALGPEASKLEEAMKPIAGGVAAEHYRQALDGFTQRKWESANGQVRSFLEAFFCGIGTKVTGRARTDANAALQDLRDAGFLDCDEFNQFRALWSGVQDKGPHAGLSHDEEALFRIHTSTALARYLLARLRGS